ncbi:eye-specific diacylglycerol kinase isoform X1 [Bombus vosnesenskii]|uniref:Diacylglycerol kinase n=1 Tax=Bombus vosnesenskii TaxID=207650 RepID=A0A6J3KB89_9HYME|nr:eye-specific diacylglycerol kinase isoform X1 [Bombus vosnesenskii]XP_033349309.1 eye-specific diacylglycerol kinase isoform X1 [Bombus vosnesenskii]
MQRLRSTFKRSRTPTGAEMKSQSSLEVPKQVRSASFDEIQLEAKRQDDVRDGRSTRTTSSSSSSCSPARSQDSSRGRRSATLRVPQLHSGQRSKSFDVAERSYGSSSSQQSLGSVRRPETPTIQVSGCYHCICVEEYKNLYLSRDEDDPSSREDLDDEADVVDDTSEDEDSELVDKSEASPEIRVTLTTFTEKEPDVTDVVSETTVPPDTVVPEVVPKVVQDEMSDISEVRGGLFPGRERRRSISSPKLARQEALTSYPLELPTVVSSTEDEEESTHDLSSSKCKFVVRDIFLTVPELKRDRAASVDSCFNNKNGHGEDADTLTVPQQNIRSKSVDIVLPTEAQTRYTALLPDTEARPPRGGREEGGTSGGHREPRSTPDWGPGALNGEHLWVPTSASGDFCYVNDCSKHGPRMKCAACRVVAHAVCAVSLNFACKSSFRDVGVRQYREQTNTHHHWVHRRSQKGKCANCGKSFQSKLSFTSKEIVAVSCSWCKLAYHNKEACFNVQKIGENCELGIHASIVVPPSWIVKLPRKGSFKSSLRKSPRKKKSGSGAGTVSNRKKSKEKDKDKEQDKDQGMLWVVKPIPTPSVKPVLVFINPKSGGNQGAKLLQKFQWLLNPRQVFDLTQGGPKMGLELFKTVPNLRVLACGGDGTVGWVLSILDQIGASPPPAVGVLPLGTGNDLARALGWGGGYTDEPIGKILTNIGESDTTLLDRWQLVVERNPDAQGDDDNGKGKENLPLNVVNNYFSLGVDAHIALEFHEAREAHPERFNSRLRNKVFYGQMGGKDLVRRKWKDLSEFVTLDCDGQDMTPKLKEHRVHAIVFLNIASYGGGTHPWGAASGTKEPSTEDGMIEVVGLTTYQLPLLQAGGHGTCIAQCSTAKLVTTRTIPMQVDGEACRLLPSIINLKLLNKATMLAKRKNASKPQQDVKLERLKLPVMKIKMLDYERYHHDKDMLKKAATTWIADPLDLDATTDLESLRKILAKDHNMDTCCFLDSCTAERFFRIDRAQEQLHYVTDVAVEAVYVLEESASNQLNEPDGTKMSTSQESAAADPSPSEERPKKNAAMTNEKPKEEPKAQPVSEPQNATPETAAPETTAPETTAPEIAAPESPPETAAPESPHETPLETKIQDKDQDTAKSHESMNKDAPQDESPNVKKEEKISGDANKQSSSSKSISATVVSQSQNQTPPTFISPRDRLFGLSSEVHTFHTRLLEKASDGILKAAKIGDLQALKEFHEKGYSLLSIDSSGQTALHLASRYGHKDIVRYLIACAPSSILNMIDNDKGQTALHKAAQYKRRSICCMLVAGGATLIIKDRHGNTPRDLALQAEDRDLAAYLCSQEQFQLTTEEMENAL